MKLQDPRRIIEVTDLTIGWSTDRPLMEHATFHVEQGEIFAILGGSGSGKSTLLRYLIGLAEPIEGEVLIAGIGRPNLDRGQPPYGVMFQAGALFGSMTVADNVALPIEEWTDLPPQAIAAMVHDKLRLVGLGAAGDLLPSELSGGMKKRASIARAMALEPAILFLDEPSSGLDPATSAGLDALILTLRRVVGLTVVVVTHDLVSIHAIADRCIMLDAETKSIVATGDPADLARSTHPRVREFFHPSSRAA
jgi:phospholipid/cholesterol/gamma-HCH transport system ATP-binding protein